MTELFVAWRNPDTSSWYTVGRLRYNHKYRFDYTQGALDAHREAAFSPFPSFPNFYLKYDSPILFSFFANRLMHRHRSDFGEFSSWVSPRSFAEDPIGLLAYSGGRRQTDSLELFPRPTHTKPGIYHIRFFIHGLSHMPSCAITRADSLRIGEKLLLARDGQNAHDRCALLIRTAQEREADLYALGFVPRYLAQDLCQVVDLEKNARIRVVQVNRPPAPVQFRVLCGLVLRVSQGPGLFEGEAYQPIIADEQWISHT